MGALDSLSGIVTKDGDLGPHLPLGLAGKAEYLALPRTRAELGRVTARRVRRATQKALSRVAAGADVEGVAWPTRREHGDPWNHD